MSDPPKSSREKPLVNPFTTQGMIRDPRLFFGRTAELAAIWDYLRKDANVSIVAERRMGKSSLLWYVKEIAPRELGREAPFEIHYLDLELVAEAEEFFSRMAEMLKTTGDTTRDLERALAQRRLVLCLDEFDRTAGNPAFPADFFAVLRGLSQVPNLTLVVATKTPLIDFSANGSMTSPFYNIFPPTPVTLGPLTDDEARTLLAQTAARAEIKFDDTLLANAIKLAQGLPWHLQLLGSHLVETRMDWDEAERRFRASLKENGGAPALRARRGADRRRAAAPSWVAPLASLLMALSVIIGIASAAMSSLPGLYVSLLLGALFFVLLAVEFVYARKR
jgi:hypothetical protein